MPEAGWYDDPEDATRLRYWDGAAWTDAFQPRPATPPPPPPAGMAPPGSPPPGPAPGPAAGPAAGPAPGPAGDAAPAGWPAPTRTFPEAIRVCLTKYVDPKGRAARSEYWYFQLFTLLLGAVAAAFSEALGNVANLAMFLPTIAAGARRMHDRGRSGWFQLWFLLPVIGWIVVIVQLASEGEPGPNQYG